MDGETHRKFHQTRHSRLRPSARQISRSRLAHGADPPRVHSRALVFLHPFAVHIAASGRQRLREGGFHCAGRFFARADACLSATGQPKAEGGSKRRTIFHPRRLRRSDVVLARSDLLFSQTEKSTPANRTVYSAITKIDQLYSGHHWHFATQSGAANQ